MPDFKELKEIVKGLKTSDEIIEAAYVFGASAELGEIARVVKQEHAIARNNQLTREVVTRIAVRLDDRIKVQAEKLAAIRAKTEREIKEASK